MGRILGQDDRGIWHIACSTYSTTMHTKCDKWVRVVNFAIEQLGCAASAPIPYCIVCKFVSNLAAPLSKREL